MNRLNVTIKEATKAAHQKLEKKVVLQLKSIRNKEDYAYLLQYFHSYFNCLEKEMSPFITEALLPDYKERRNSGYLQKDIAALGELPLNLPNIVVPQIENRLQALGALYVMEGSVMGGGIIVQMLAKRGITKGVSFFSGYGTDTGKMWGSFRDVLDRHAVAAEQQRMVIQTAIETFQCFSQLFESELIIKQN